MPNPMQSCCPHARFSNRRWSEQKSALASATVMSSDTCRLRAGFRCLKARLHLCLQCLSCLFSGLQLCLLFVVGICCCCCCCCLFVCFVLFCFVCFVLFCFLFCFVLFCLFVCLFVCFLLLFVLVCSCLLFVFGLFACLLVCLFVFFVSVFVVCCFRRVSETPTPICIAVSSWVLTLEERKTQQYTSHFYCNTPPICTAVHLPFVRQYF